MSWVQRTIKVGPFRRGFHLITDDIIESLPEITNVHVGLLNLFVQHTSASIGINENADPDVRHDLEAHFNKLVPEMEPHYRHVLEGADDMPAHIKQALHGSQVNIPVSAGHLQLGVWQGIYFGEHRDHGGARKVIATLHGE
jgi:secondary thiamine-phosphate synthase enzyme